jgi:hypothetical protein
MYTVYMYKCRVLANLSANAVRHHKAGDRNEATKTDNLVQAKTYTYFISVAWLLGCS